uniref:Inhibitor of growth protein n=1 Tax=Arcella intermedia TaxID=1963864 RepID=A0A6B2LGE0_9EUKA
MPIELRRNFELMRQLDEKNQDVVEKFNTIINEYKSGKISEATKLSIEELKGQLQDCIDRGEEKIKIAGQSYEVVDKHIRRLDQDLKKFEQELERESLQKKQQQKQVLKAQGKQKNQKNGIEDSSEVETRKPKKARTQVDSDFQPSSLDTTYNTDLYDVNQGFDMPEMPIDPNEPLYCTCRRVSFGNMIGCDDPNCPIEWFHFECVGLTDPVKGKWYCPTCREKQ